MPRKQIRRSIDLLCCITSLLVALALPAEEMPFTATNPGQANPAGVLSEGEAGPHFQATDQFGKEQTDASIADKNGTVLLFFRSADW